MVDRMDTIAYWGLAVAGLGIAGSIAGGTFALTRWLRTFRRLEPPAITGPIVRVPHALAFDSARSVMVQGQKKPHHVPYQLKPIEINR